MSRTPRAVLGEGAVPPQSSGEYFGLGQVAIEWFKPWLKMMRAELATGKRMERVRLIDDPA